MKKDQIKFFKHSLQDYDYLWRRYNELNDIREDLIAERLALATNTKSVLKVVRKQDGEWVDLYSTDKWRTITQLQEDCEKEIRMYSRLIEVVDKTLAGLEEPFRSMLDKLYIKKIPRREVSRNHFYSDEKAMYRAIRNYLRRENAVLYIHD